LHTGIGTRGYLELKITLNRPNLKIKKNWNQSHHLDFKIEARIESYLETGSLKTLGPRIEGFS
jgi:hypothetical protein